MTVLVDTSIWIDFFRGKDTCADMDILLDENRIVTNDIILTELIPFLEIRKQYRVIELLYDIVCLPLDINWQEIIDNQIKFLKAGFNGIGIPDLIISQNALQNNCLVYSLDKHFHQLHKITGLKLYPSQ